MMKRSYLLLLSILLATAATWAQRTLPVSVHQFLDERTWCGRFQPMPSLMGQYSTYVPAQMVNGIEMVDAFIAIDSDDVIDALQNEGVHVNCIFDGFVTAQIPVRRLTDISLLTGVTDVEISRKVQLCTDSTLSATHAGQVINGNLNGLPQPYDGTDVIVGIIDQGYDYQHRAFRRKDNMSQTRIVRVYDTTHETGHPVYYQKLRMPGSVFMGNEIFGLTTDRTSTHGTHTASIAAGTHVNGYGGMAPGADIVLCAVNRMEGNISLVELANCVRYIDCYADSVGKPCVMSLSISVPGGQHDGQDYFSKVVKQTCGPGRIFVIAAGNTAGQPYYATKVITRDDPMNMLFLSKYSKTADSTYFYTNLVADLWMRNQWKKFSFKFHILDKNIKRIVWESAEFSDATVIDVSSFSRYYTFDSSLDTTGYIKVERKVSSDGKKYELITTLRNLVSKSYSTVNGKITSRYAIGMSAYPQSSTICTADAWICNSYGGFGTIDGEVTSHDGQHKYTSFYSSSGDKCSIGCYAVGDSTISAGAYAARNSYYSLFQNKMITDQSIVVGDIAEFSSYQAPGYGVLPEAFPTICAPGVNVVAAGSRYSYFNNSYNTVMRTSDGSLWGVMTGTSMAAPTVAGIIALWLQVNPRLSVSQVKRILADSAIRDKYTMGTNGQKFGPNGKVDAMKGIRIVLEDYKFVIGDVDNDGFVGINDLSMLIDYILRGSSIDPINIAAADVDKDGYVGISDVSELIDILLKS